MPNVSTQKKVRFYSIDNPPPVIECDASNKPVPVYDWIYNEDSKQVEPVKVGERDPQADIQAAKGETLAEVMARMPGRTHLDKLNNAVNLGIINPGAKDGGVTDLRAVKPDFVENMATVEKGAAAYKEDPEIAKAPGSTYTEKAINYFQEKIKAMEAAQAKPAEGDKQ